MAGKVGNEGVYANGVEEIVAEMRATFLEEAADQLRSLELLLSEVRHDRQPLENLVREVRRFALTLKAQSATLDVKAVAALGHRLEDYFAEAKYLPPRVLDDVQNFIEIALDLVEGGAARETDPAALVRRLPAKIGIEIGDIQVRNVEILLVMLHGTATHYVERELQQCGYRTILATSTLEAIPMILHTKPDMVIISAVMPELSGIDLAIGLASMPGTRNTPTALITSLAVDDDYLKLVPRKVPVIRKGPSFGDDLAQALDQLFLI
ncbi:MAG: Hpt domain-containing protein [Alphaproteobacteria bacterium]|nr:Hpt domain-containing protein [Alphaproteobacteria bacterium]